MRRMFRASIVASAFAFALTVPATTLNARAQAPSGATAQCKDGTYSTAKSKRGACSGHGGIASWLADSNSEKPKPTAADKSPRNSDSPANQPTSTSERSAARPSAAPGDATGLCKDGSYTTAASKRGACSGHGGIGTWFAASGANGKALNPEKSATSDRAGTPTSAPKAQPHTPTAQTADRPSSAPETATAQCNDGTYSYAKQHRGACSGHHGVKTWFR
jgi:hypothetical protein